MIIFGRTFDRRDRTFEDPINLPHGNLGWPPAEAIATMHPARALDQTAGNIKTAALLMLGFDRAEAESILARHKGNLRRVLVDRGT